MTDTQQTQLGKVLWGIADDLRGAMNADDFRDYMLSLLFLRYRSTNYEQAAARELGGDLPPEGELGPSLVKEGRSALSEWYDANEADVRPFEAQMRRKAHYVIEPQHLWTNIAYLARTQSGDLLNTLQESFTYIENESFQANFAGLFSEINLASDKLGRTYADRNEKLCTIVQRIAEGLAEFRADVDALGDAYEYLIGQFAAGERRPLRTRLVRPASSTRRSGCRTSARRSSRSTGKHPGRARRRSSRACTSSRAGRARCC